MDTFKIDSPTCISFSGGRTSAYMLWRVLQAHDGKLPDEAVVCFANTGKEEEATLRFVDRCSKEWQVPITWLEYVDAPEVKDRFKVVDFDSASRKGEPFEKLIRKKNYLPNTFARFCTSELKILVIDRYLKSVGINDYSTFVGIRADEPRRVAKMRANADSKETPLASAGVSQVEVQAFWASQNFDLELVTLDGNALLGNCDLCFLKKMEHKLNLIKQDPSRADWWVAQEAKMNSVFRQDHPSYAAMLKFSKEQRDMFDPNEEAIACFCGD